MATVKVAKGRNVIEIDESKIGEAQALGYDPVSQGQVDRIADVEYAGTALGGAQGIGEGLARGASLGFSDSLLRAAGVDAGGLAARAEGDASAIAEVTGAVAPAILSGGTGAAGTAARFTLAGRTAQVGRAITGATEAAVGRGVVSRVVGAGTAGAFEGAIGGMGAAASEAALGDRDLAAEHLLAGTKRGAGLGALFGAGATTLGIGLEHAYVGGQKVSRSLLERAAGAGSPGPGATKADGLAHGLMRRQMEFLGGTPDDLAAAERNLERTRTEAGRKLAELAEAKPTKVAYEVGERIRSAALSTRADDAVASWASRWRTTPSARKAIADRGWEAWNAFIKSGGSGARDKAEIAFRKALKFYEPEHFDDYMRQRSVLVKALDDLRVENPEAAARGAALAQDILAARDDAAIWGGDVARTHNAIEAAQQAEAAALAKMAPAARKALRGETKGARGAELDPTKLARAIGTTDPAVLSEVIAARRSVVTALEDAGEDVASIRQGLDDLERSVGYRREIEAARADLQRVAKLRKRDASGRFQDPTLALLPESVQGIARKLKGVQEGAGLGAAALRGLSLGGSQLAELVGKIGSAASRPGAVLRVIARARGAVDAVQARSAGAVQAFGRLADGGARAARQSGAVARRVPPAVARQRQQQRRQEALDTLARVSRLAADPEAVAEEMGPAVLPLRAAAPSVAGSVIAGAARAAAYLRAVAPPVMRPTGAGRDVQMVDPFALDAWARRADAIADPPAALDRAAAGTLTRDEAEALEAVYPRLWASFQEGIMTEVGKRAREGKPLSFAARNALGTIGGVAADDSLRPSDFAAIQASMSPPPPHPPAPPPRSQIKPTAPSLPKWQALESKA